MKRKKILSTHSNEYVTHRFDCHSWYWRLSLYRCGVPSMVRMCLTRVVAGLYTYAKKRRRYRTRGQWKGTVFVVELHIVGSRSHVLDRVLSRSQAIISLYIIFYSNRMTAAAAAATAMTVAVTASAVNRLKRMRAQQCSYETNVENNFIFMNTLVLSHFVRYTFFVLTTFDYVRWRKCT